MHAETKDVRLVGIAQRHSDDALQKYKRRVARGVTTVMPRLLEKVRPETSQRAAAALALYNDLPEVLRDEIVYHPFFCSWWIKMRAAFAAGDLGRLSAQLDDFSSFVLIPALQAGHADGSTLVLTSDFRGELRFPGHLRHIAAVFAPHARVETRIGAEAIWFTTGADAVSVEIGNLLAATGDATGVLVTRPGIGPGDIEVDASDAWIMRFFESQNARPTDGKIRHNLAPYEPLDTQVVGHLERALSLLKEYQPPFYAEFCSYVRLVVPCVSQVLSTFTDTGLFGALFMSELRARFSDDMLTAEHLLHEASHLRLTLLMEEDPIIVSAPDVLVTSPWRPDPRPLHQILHGSFVFARIVQFLQSAGESSGEARYAERCAEVQGELRAGLATLASSGVEFTPAGQQMLAEITDVAWS
jgi:HEXXH motif-containing protein